MLLIKLVFFWIYSINVIATEPFFPNYVEWLRKSDETQPSVVINVNLNCGNIDCTPKEKNEDNDNSGTKNIITIQKNLGPKIKAAKTKPPTVTTTAKTNIKPLKATTPKANVSLATKASTTNITTSSTKKSAIIAQQTTLSMKKSARTAHQTTESTMPSSLITTNVDGYIKPDNVDTDTKSDSECSTLEEQPLGKYSAGYIIKCLFGNHRMDVEARKELETDGSNESEDQKPEDDNDRSSTFINVTAEYCINEKCQTVYVPQSPTLYDLQPNKSSIVTTISIQKGQIPALFAGAVQNLQLLDHLKMNNVGLETLEPQAFQNLPSLKYLSLKQNNLFLIDANVFNLLIALETLNLEHNNIVAISPKSFANMPSLINLYLSHNKLETFDYNWFENNIKLRNLHFEHNEIRKLPTHAFRSLNLMGNMSLNFEFNKIEKVEPELFSLQQPILGSVLNLRYNRISCIRGSMDSFFKASHIRLEGNPLTCTCLHKIFNFTFYHDHPAISLTPHNDCKIRE